MQVQSPGQEDPLDKEMATHSNNLVWKIPWTIESGGLQSISWKESDTTEHAPIFILNLATRHGMWDLCSLPRDQTRTPCLGRAEC